MIRRNPDIRRSIRCGGHAVPLGLVIRSDKDWVGLLFHRDGRLVASAVVNHAGKLMWPAVAGIVNRIWSGGTNADSTLM
jgi:hypothetical protein